MDLNQHSLIIINGLSELLFKDRPAKLGHCLACVEEVTIESLAILYKVLYIGPYKLYGFMHGVLVK